MNLSHGWLNLLRHLTQMTPDYFTYTDNCSNIELIRVIEKFLKKMIRESDDDCKLYFAGEGDSNCTEFEELSNNMEIAVLSSNQTVALVLLRLLRIIIDENGDMLIEDVFFGWGYDATKGEEGVTMTEPNTQVPIISIINKLAECERSYMRSFLLHQKLATNLRCKESNVVKKMEEIDIWTMPRIMSAIKEYLY